ncbi:helix-turn-helix domain-containing protein [Achromobacter anxifer]|jgi:AraC family transcriptional activator of tynA and feaB|uniref:Transcriptional activator NphR n=1 Tax=Achromobacter anxifer TaxID=1287737 RepID=A0A6S7EC65_9BURK|nr:helix-turn-helix domain-containing protein [Achromobacter anxifer]MDF8363995.1 helix-turn-helix domain-containing protein [Achromobacter anxifer]CAB3905866.1 Transcriptional activator NphR [Achromobacter anxifer]CAB5512956.1 Transcriptional activator NphR [Achromobacter anxifer]
MSAQAYHHTTDVIAPQDQFAYWRDAICDAYVPLEPERDAARSFRGQIDGLLLPDLHGSTITAQSHVVRLSAAGLAARTQSPFFANLLCVGEAVISQGGSAMRARAGDVYVVDCASPWEVDFRTDFRMFCIEIPEGLLRPQLGRRGKLATPVLDGAAGAGRVLASYMRLVSELPANELQHVQALMVRHCSELLSRTQLESAEAGAHGAERVRHEVLDRILALVQRRLADRDLTPASASEELGMSRSYLFKILAEHGLSFSAHVRLCRLEQCRQAIETQPGRSIADIAASWGFEEVSTFNRAYRAQYGRSPGSERGGAPSRTG